MRLLLICFIFLFSTCAIDSSVDSYIVNKTKNTVTVVIEYDRAFFDSAYNSKQDVYLLFLKRINEESGVLYSLDTSLLTSTIILHSNERLRVDHIVGGIGVTPDHSILNSITIQSPNGTKSYQKKQLDTAFKRKDRGLWEIAVE